MAPMSVAEHAAAADNNSIVASPIPLISTEIPRYFFYKKWLHYNWD